MSTEQPYKPETPIKVRKVIYWIGVILAAATLLAVGLILVLLRDYTVETLAIAGVVNSVWLYVSNQLAVKYVPPELPSR